MFTALFTGCGNITNKNITNDDIVKHSVALMGMVQVGADMEKYIDEMKSQYKYQSKLDSSVAAVDKTMFPVIDGLGFNIGIYQSQKEEVYYLSIELECSADKIAEMKRIYSRIIDTAKESSIMYFSMYKVRYFGLVDDPKYYTSIYEEEDDPKSRFIEFVTRLSN